jgi:hypothetical protein
MRAPTSSSSVARAATDTRWTAAPTLVRASLAAARRRPASFPIAARAADADAKAAAETADLNPTPSRRALLLLTATSAAALLTPASLTAHAAAAARVPAAAGWTLRPPAGWTVAYDRTADDAAATSSATPPPASGPRVMWANFASLGTIVVSRATRSEVDLTPPAPSASRGDADSAVLALVEPLLAEARDSPATYGWRVLATATRDLVMTTTTTTAAYDVEYVQQICRGEVLEASGGQRRCANPRDDSDLLVVSRHFVMSVAADPAEAGVVWVVRGSCPSENWAETGPKIAAAVRSFSFIG